MINKIDTSRSSNINSVEYNGSSLLVEFKNGSIYEYYNVPEKVFEDFRVLKESDSFGKYFISNIRSNYDFKKVKEAQKVRIHK